MDLPVGYLVYISEVLLRHVESKGVNLLTEDSAMFARCVHSKCEVVNGKIDGDTKMLLNEIAEGLLKARQVEGSADID